MKYESAVKLIMSQEFERERSNDRGQVTNQIGDCLTAIEIEVQKKISRLNKGEDIFSILPELADKDLDGVNLEGE